MMDATQLDVVPLHGFPVATGQWWACSQPERAADEDIAYDGRCQACVLAAEAELRINGDEIVPILNQGQRSEQPLSSMVERSRELLRELHELADQ